MIKTLTVAAALIGGALVAASASAAPIGAASGPALALATGADGLVETVQYRRYYGPGYGYYRGPSRGAAVGAGIAAGVLGGALAAGALAGPRYYEPAPVYVEPAPVYAAPVPRAYGYGVEDVDAVAYCSRRFRSYNPETGTYIAAGGVVRACP